MTPQDFRRRFVPVIAARYLTESNKITLQEAFASLNNGQRNRIQKLFEDGNTNKAGTALQFARLKLANAFALERANEIIADDSISLETELDKLL